MHELPRGAAVAPCQGKELLERGPGACEGGGVREFLYAEPLGVNASAPPDGQWEKTLESFALPNAVSIVDS